MRHILAATMVSAGLALTQGAAGAQTFPRDEPDRQIDHWTGTYEGYNDGRRARMTIEHEQTIDDGLAHVYAVTLEDLDRNKTFRGEGTTNPTRGWEPHNMLFAAPLAEVGGSDEKMVNGLYIHTWDTDHISGRTKWGNEYFGLIFHRVE